MKLLAQPKRGPVLVPLSACEAARINLVCFHFAGGSAQSFFRWRSLCGTGINLYAAEMPGRGRRFGEPFTGSIGEAAEEFASALAEDSRLPTIFFGHSLGAIVAYETATVLKRRGWRGPEQLVVSSSPSPGWRSGIANFPNLSDASLTHYLRSVDGTPASVIENKAFMQLALRILRNDLGLLNRYQSSAAGIDVPLYVIGGSGDEAAPIESLLAWHKVAEGPFHLQFIEGGHFSVFEQPHAVLGALKQTDRVFA